MENMITAEEYFRLKAQSYLRMAKPHCYIMPGITPHNDFLFISCYYHQLVAAYSYFGVDKNLLFANYTSEYSFSKEKKLAVNEKRIKSVEEFEIITGIRETVSHKSDDIVQECIDSIKSENPIIIAADCFYLPYRETTFNISHMQHYLLVYGFDSVSKTFTVMDHMHQNSYIYSSKELKYNELRNAFNTCSELFAKDNNRGTSKNGIRIVKKVV